PAPPAGRHGAASHPCRDRTRGAGSVITAEDMKKTVVVALALLFCTVAAHNAMAQSDLGFKRLGVSAGVVSPEDVDATLGFGAFVELGTIAPRFALSSHLDYWSHSEDIPGGGDASIRDIALTCRGKYLFPVNSTVQPFLGAGLGMHFLGAEIDVPGAGSASDSETRLGIDIGGGMMMPMNPRPNFHAEAWYSIVDDGTH